MAPAVNAKPWPVGGVYERRLYLYTAVITALIVLAGFARSYYLRPFFTTAALAPILHLHGAVMTLWFLLIIAQTALVAAGRTDLHRVLGVFTATTAAALVPIAIVTTMRYISRSIGDPEMLGEAAAESGFDWVLLATFTLLVATALILRRRSDVHKRLMMLAAVSLLGPPLARIIGDQTAVLVSNGLVVVLVLVDVVRNRRLHPAFGWGGSLVIISSQAAVAMVSSPGWTNIAVRLVS